MASADDVLRWDGCCSDYATACDSAHSDALKAVIVYIAVSLVSSMKAADEGM